MKYTTLIVHLWLEPGAGMRASVRLLNSEPRRYFADLGALHQYLLECGHTLEGEEDAVVTPQVNRRGLLEGPRLELGEKITLRVSRDSESLHRGVYSRVQLE